MEWLRRQLSDRQAVASWVAIALIGAAFGAFYLSWRGAAATLTVSLQLPYAVSGAVGGVLLLVAGASLVLVQSRRRRHLREERLLRDVLDGAYDVLDAVTETADRRRSSSDVRARPK